MEEPRKDSILRSLIDRVGNLASRRLEMINNVRQRFGIPHNGKLQGVIVTSFIEPNINVPAGFICLSIDKLNKIFGKKATIPQWRKNPVLQIPEDIVKEAHKKMGIRH